eukprot:COSAG01_NODE_5431_length_4266_cov_18.916838_4_plen_227_part_01
MEELRRPEGDEGSAELGLHKRPALAAHTPPERNRRGRPHPPPWRLLALVAFGSFGGLAAFGWHIVYRLSAGRSPVPGARDEHDELRLREVSPATCPGRTLLAVARCIARPRLVCASEGPVACSDSQSWRRRLQALTLYGVALLGVSLLCVAGAGWARADPAAAEAEGRPVHVLGAGRRRLLVWDTVQLSLLPLHLGMGRHGGSLGRAAAELVRTMDINATLLATDWD